MIYSDSRYATGNIAKAYDQRVGTYQVGVSRTWPVIQSNYYVYTWKDNDRLDTLAYKMSGNADFWWKILDANPEIIDPMNIPPGTEVRLPRV